MAKSSKNKISRAKVAMQRGVNCHQRRLISSRNTVLRPKDLLHIIKKAGWPSANFCEQNLKSGKYTIDLHNAVSFQVIAAASPTKHPIHSIRKPIPLPRKPFSPSNRLALPYGKHTLFSDKKSPKPITDPSILPLPDRPQSSSKASVLCITISNHKNQELAMEAMESLVNTVSNVERFDRCDPPLGDCSLSNGNAVCWVNGQSLIQIWDTKFGLEVEDLRGVTDGIDGYFNCDRIEVEENEKPVIIPAPALSVSQELDQVHVYPSIVSTFDKASIFINVPVITRNIFKDVDPDGCQFKCEGIENEMVKCIDNYGRMDGVFEFLAQAVGASKINFSIRSWSDDTTRRVAVQVEVKADTEPDEVDEDGQLGEHGQRREKQDDIEEGEVCA